MTRRLLFDQNRSPRLIDRLGSRFPDSAHALTVGLSTASDAQVLEFAAGQDFVVVTKDKDFADLVRSHVGLRTMLGVSEEDVLESVGFDVRERKAATR